MNAKSLTRSLTGTSAAVLLLSGVAMAQTTTPPATTTQQPPAAVTAPKPLPPAASPLQREDVSKIIGATIYGPDDKKIGTVSTVLMQPSQLKIDRFVVSEGGVLGIGSHLVALPVDEFQWDSAKGVFRVAMSAEELKNMPEWKEQLTQLPAQ